MKQKQPTSNAVPVIIGVIVIILTAFYVAVQQVKAPDPVEDKTAAMEETLPVIEDDAGLTEAQAELDEANPDDLDTEMMELEKDSASF